MAFADIVRTAWADRERARLGLPTRAEEAARRQEQEIAAATSASQLESAQLGREKTRAEIAALPAQQDLERRATEALITQREREPQARMEPSSLLERIMAMPPEQQAAALKLHRDMNPRSERPERDPWSGWKDIYTPEGKFAGFAHPAAGYRPASDFAGLPSGAKPGAPTAGERTSLALGAMGVRAGDNMRQALAATREAETASPLDPSTMTGPLAGRVGSVYRELIDTSGPAGDFDQARAEGRTLVYDLSGKQLNETELEWLDNMLPRLTDRGVEQQIERFERFVTAIREAKKAGYSDPFSYARMNFDRTLPSAGGDPLRNQGEGVTAPIAPPASASKIRKRYNPQTGRVE